MEKACLPDRPFPGEHVSTEDPKVWASKCSAQNVHGTPHFSVFQGIKHNMAQSRSTMKFGSIAFAVFLD